MAIADPELLDEVYRFCVARAKEIATGALPGHERDSRSNAQSMLKLFASMRRDVLANPWSGSEAVDYFRRRAMRWKDHSDFDPIWTIDT
ncbi:hypothetical protein GUY44_24285 [Pimelobacter simplex]|uniref:hypothetical protein n=1 Tax=Nocardioides simplex TaxID=2045 RepID=UPI000535B80C|nr:hypothetical protein [Pimelobacter simplex]MCG8153617.1 hypothetical protein [Pimelobacter simplex]GEB17088.1 hypothetical protein NSI01_54030 [Pimelobacter simplex]SFN07894.1 hypothetical protein SAMN05421671_4976 [Pimelobacter simplex]